MGQLTFRDKRAKETTTRAKEPTDYQGKRDQLTFWQKVPTDYQGKKDQLSNRATEIN